MAQDAALLAWTQAKPLDAECAGYCVWRNAVNKVCNHQRVLLRTCCCHDVCCPLPKSPCCTASNGTQGQHNPHQRGLCCSHDSVRCTADLTELRCTQKPDSQKSLQHTSAVKTRAQQQQRQQMMGGMHSHLGAVPAERQRPLQCTAMMVCEKLGQVVNTNPSGKNWPKELRPPFVQTKALPPHNGDTTQRLI